MAIARALFAGLTAGNYKVSFVVKNKKGSVELKVTDAVDLEYSWYDFARTHGFPASSLTEVEEVSA